MDFLGYDASINVYSAWEIDTLQRHNELIRERWESLSLSNRSKLIVENLDFSHLNARGFKFLCFRTHFISYISSPENFQKHLAEIKSSLALALVMSGKEVCINCSDYNHGYLLDGTNLYADLGNNNKLNQYLLTLNGLTNRGTFNDIEFSFKIDNDRLIFSDIATHLLISLPYDEDFIFFFKETEDKNAANQLRILLDDKQLIEEELSVLLQAKTLLKIHTPTVWNAIKKVVLYVNWTGGDRRESATILHESLAAVVLNRRANSIKSETRQAAWLAHGLYHEFKHIQFFLFFRLKSNNPFSLSALTESLSGDRKSLPCAWRGIPTGRTLGDGLLALQAFVPGLIVFFQLLMTTKVEEIELWLIRRIEIEMRGVNGGLSILKISKDELSQKGQALTKTLWSDYQQYLAPKAKEYYLKLKNICHE